MLRHSQVMSDHDDGISHFMQPMKQLQHFFSTGLIQCAGGFVCQQYGWFPYQCSGNGYSLLLAAGQFSRLVVHTFFQPQHSYGFKAGLFRFFLCHVTSKSTRYSPAVFCSNFFCIRSETILQCSIRISENRIRYCV